MSYLTDNELNSMGFKFLGNNVKVSKKASIYNPELISIDDNSRIDDFCVVSGKVSIGKNVHIAVFVNIAGGSEGVVLKDFVGLAYRCSIFARSDDYSGETLTNPTIPETLKKVQNAKVIIGKHVIIGTNSIVFPGVYIEEGCSIGALSIVKESTKPWGIYVGIPAKRVKDRLKNLLLLEDEFKNTFK